MRYLMSVLLALPAPALACSVCFSATDQNREAFLDTTILLTGLPLLLVGAGIYWLYLRTSQVAG